MTTPQGMLELADANLKDADEFCRGAFGPFVTDVSQYTKIVAELMQHATDRALASRQAAAPQGREADAWQWRACIGGKWGSWLYLEQPVEQFKERNRYNFRNGTYELRPLFALTLAVAPDGAGEKAITRAKDALDNIARCHGYKLTGLELNEAVRAVARALTQAQEPGEDKRTTIMEDDNGKG